MIKTIPISQARQNLTALVDEISRLKGKSMITVNGKPAVILLSIDEYESLEETLDILSDPELVQAIKEGEEDIKAGRVYDWEDVKKELGWDDLHVKAVRKGKKRTEKYL